MGIKSDLSRHNHTCHALQSRKVKCTILGSKWDCHLSCEWVNLITRAYGRMCFIKFISVKLKCDSFFRDIYRQSVLCKKSKSVNFIKLTYTIKGDELSWGLTSRVIYTVFIWEMKNHAYLVSLKTRDTKIWYLPTTKKASVPKIPKIGTLVPKIGISRYQIDSFWYLEIPIFGI